MRKVGFPRAFLGGFFFTRAFRDAHSLPQRSGSRRLLDGFRVESVVQPDRVSQIRFTNLLFDRSSEYYAQRSLKMSSARSIDVKLLRVDQVWG